MPTRSRSAQRLLYALLATGVLVNLGVLVVALAFGVSAAVSLTLGAVCLVAWLVCWPLWFFWL